MADDTSYICTVSHTDKVKGKFVAGTVYTRDQMPDDVGKHYFKTVTVETPGGTQGDPPEEKPDTEKAKGKGVKK